MGTTFVTLTKGRNGDEPGFWMRDELLELWLRLLALHLPEPNDAGEHTATLEIRNQWLLASRGYFTGFVPHAMEDACSTKEGREVVRHAIKALIANLSLAESPLDTGTINLLGMEYGWEYSSERQPLRDIGRAFLDLLDGKIKCTARSTNVMPGSKPYTSPSA